MTEVLNRLLFNRYIYFLSKGNKRFAGHSKWANIKHIKAEKDNERMVLFHHLKLQMQIAIQGIFIMTIICIMCLLDNKLLHLKH